MEVQSDVKLKVKKTVDMKKYQQEYQQKNKERILYKIKQNYIQNRDKKLEYMRTPNDCICGGRFTNVNYQQHLKSKKHQAHEFSKLFVKQQQTLISKKGDVYEAYSDYQTSDEK
jgi:hypothetical protein